MTTTLTATATAACSRDEAEPLAVRWRISYSGWTWLHAAESRGYDGVSKTLCGKRPYDPEVVHRGPHAWLHADCGSCQRIVRRRADQRKPPGTTTEPGALL